MSDVKTPFGKNARTYRSPLRAEQALRTRERVIAAARALFVAQGYAGTSLRAVAESAGVAPETIFDIFGNKRTLLEAVIAAAINESQDEPDDWLERSWVKKILILPRPAERLRRWIKHTATTLARTSPVHAVIRGAASSDPEFEHLHQRLQAERFAAHRALIEPMIGRPATDDEAETFSALTSPELHHLLTVTRGWSQQRYAEWLEQTVTSLLSADARPSRTPRPSAAQ
jgi:AcrR family transcriptional regulator